MEKKMSEAYKKYRELLEIWHNSSPSELEKKLSIDDWQCLLKHAGTAQAKIYCSQWIEKLQKMGRDHDEKIEWYDFDNIYIETGKLYDQEGNLIIPGHYTHPKNGNTQIITDYMIRKEVLIKEFMRETDAYFKSLTRADYGVVHAVRRPAIPHVRKFLKGLNNDIRHL